MNPIDISELRNKLGMSTVKFWQEVKVSAATGWRYEHLEGHKIPEPVKELVRLRYSLGIDTSKINEQTAPLIKRILSADNASLESAFNVLSAADAISKATARIVEQHVRNITKENKA